jgi:HEAT repeat protein
MEILVNAARADSACVNCGSAGCGLGRTIVIQQLIDLGETEIVISILMPLLHVAELSPYSRLDAATTLARLGKASEATPVLIELLHHQNTTEHSRRGAMEALGKWGERHEEVLQELLTVAQDTAAKENDRWRAVEALGNFGNRSSLVLETLAEVARSNPDHLVGRSACESLWKLTEENFDPPVT